MKKKQTRKPVRKTSARKKTVARAPRKNKKSTRKPVKKTKQKPKKKVFILKLTSALKTALKRARAKEIQERKEARQKKRAELKAFADESIWKDLVKPKLNITFVPLGSAPTAETNISYLQRGGNPPPSEEALDLVRTESIKDIAAREMKERAERMNNHKVVPISPLLALYEKGVRFVVSHKSGRYTESTKEEASHILHPSTTEDEKTGKEVITSVCAQPIKRKFKYTKLNVTRPFPKKSPVYRADAHVRGKRKILLYLCQAMKLSNPYQRRIAGMESEECDQFYNDLIRASRWKFNDRGTRWTNKQLRKVGVE